MDDGTPQNFAARLELAQKVSAGLLCVGLDPDLEKFPGDIFAASPKTASAQSVNAAVLAFNKRIIDATCEITAAYKPQSAFYAAIAAEEALTATIRYIRERAPHALVIFDGKRNDIGNTAEAYARESFDRYAADAATVNPYMGEDSIRPFLTRPDRGAVLLCRTSNAGGKDFQDLMVDGAPLYMQVARRAARDWNAHGNLMLVVGATNPTEMASLRKAHPELTFLVPGIGAQGGDLEAILAAGLNADGAGLLISASRSINYAEGGSAAGIRAAATELYSAINRRRPGAATARVA
jgi:orotidine-5'-phosphate decarboxylase